MKKIISIDSNIFIWGIKEQSSPGQEANISKSKNFIKWIDSKGYLILLPAPMLTEILSPVPPSERSKVMGLIGKRFLISPFDVVAATKCAELLHRSYTDNELKKYREEHSVPKQKIKYDCMIASICIVKNIECLYTSDVRDMNKFSNGELLIKELPDIKDIGTQRLLF